jgi:hypothetical protein
MSVILENQQSESIEVAARRFVSDPSVFFDMSFTKMHSVAPERLKRLQIAALNLRFQEHVKSIPMVTKLAARQRIFSLESFEAAVPLLFEHSMYKSYPLKLLERKQFGELTNWLDKLTSVDLAGVDASNCDSIDSWLDVLASESSLDVAHSSGTSGTMTFFPWSQRDLLVKIRAARVTRLQKFGDPPSRTALKEPFHHVFRGNKFRSANYQADIATLGQPGFVHEWEPRRDADLLWLSARLRLAAVRGDQSRVEVPESLLARRAELDEGQTANQELYANWLKEIAGLQGERIWWTVLAPDLISIAAHFLEMGESWSFDSDSVVTVTGGPKGEPLPPGWLDAIKPFLNARIVEAYSMTELRDFMLMCGAGRYHIDPWIIPYVLDPTTSELLPRRGSQVGRFALFDLTSSDHWGGVITGDEAEVEFDSMCSCGATTQHLGGQIDRLSEKRGGSDKILCTATPEAYDEAMRFLVNY